MKTIESVGPSPYDGVQHALAFWRFAQRYDGPRDASVSSSVLYECQDAGFLFSGVGWTYKHVRESITMRKRSSSRHPTALYRK